MIQLSGFCCRVSWRHVLHRDQRMMQVCPGPFDLRIAYRVPCADVRLLFRKN